MALSPGVFLEEATDYYRRLADSERERMANHLDELYQLYALETTQQARVLDYIYADNTQQPIVPNGRNYDDMPGILEAIPGRQLGRRFNPDADNRHITKTKLRALGFIPLETLEAFKDFVEQSMKETETGISCAEEEGDKERLDWLCGFSEALGEMLAKIEELAEE